MYAWVMTESDTVLGVWFNPLTAIAESPGEWNKESDTQYECNGYWRSLRKHVIEDAGA